MPKTDAEVNNIVDKLHFRSFNKIWEYLSNEYEDITRKQAKRVFDQRLKDITKTEKKHKKYFNPVFSTHTNAYLMDLLENQRGFAPKYWYIFININTRYAYAYPIERKTEKEILDVLKSFVENNNVNSLTGDDESAFSSKNTVEYLTNKKISLRIIQEQQHGALSIIDRFIRTLRDMNIPTEKTKKQSGDEKYTNFTEKRMRKLMNIYNNTYHNIIQMKPSQMKDDIDLETKYIRHCLTRRYKAITQPGYQLAENEYVRYVLEHKKTDKKRYKVSRECYIISGKEGNLYILSAKDGTTRLFPRWRLISLGITKPNNIKVADTFPGISKGVVSKILRYGKDRNHYVVLFEVPGEEEVEDEIPKSYLRGKFPTKKSQLEIEFEKKKQ